jgi:hypothetical protein
MQVKRRVPVLAAAHWAIACIASLALLLVPARGAGALELNKKPNAAIDGPAAIQSGETREYSGEGSTDPDGGIASYSWGAAGCGISGRDAPRAQVTCPIPGPTRVLLTVEDNGILGLDPPALDQQEGSDAKPVCVTGVTGPSNVFLFGYSHFDVFVPSDADKVQFVANGPGNVAPTDVVSDDAGVCKRYRVYYVFNRPGTFNLFAVYLTGGSVSVQSGGYSVVVQG